MKLHTFVGSPHTHRVEAVLSHLGLDVEIEFHDLAAGGLRAADYVALNPNGRVPLLVDGSFKLWESNAIMQYLADKVGSETLFPRDARRRADVVRWQFWESTHFNKALGTLAFELTARPRLNRGPSPAGLVDLALADLGLFAPVLEHHLAGREYLVGDTLTIADYSMVTFESYRPIVPLDWKAYPNVNAYFDRVGKSEHWVRTTRAPSSAGRGAQAA
jgi:glutathione S-transferase